MISIWFFVALVVALVATHLLQRRSVAEATHATEGEHMIDGHDAKASGHKRRNGCCH